MLLNSISRSRRAVRLHKITTRVFSTTPNLLQPFERSQIRRISTLDKKPALQPIEPPLKGIRILDLSRVLAAPMATMLLADLGADVIKVESFAGDDTRSWSPPSAPLKEDIPLPDEPAESAYFLSVNRNKRSICVDFKSPQGIELMHRLVARADILVENFIPGKLEKLGLGYSQCQELNPGIIYTSISGYGQTGPYAANAGYDVVIEAEAGLMHITGEPNGPPCKVGVAVTDVSTGLYAHGAILAALLARQTTGRGVWIDCNLLETQARTFNSFKLCKPFIRLQGWPTLPLIILLRMLRRHDTGLPIQASYPIKSFHAKMATL